MMINIITDLVLFSSAIILILTVIILLFRIKIHNYYSVIILTSYFLISISIITVQLLIEYKSITKISIIGFIFLSLILSLYSIFHYLYLKSIIKIQPTFQKKDLIHIVSIFILIIPTFIFLKPDSFYSGSLEIDQISLLNSIYFSNQNNIIIFVRLLQPSFYLVLSLKLVYYFYKTTFSDSINKNKIKFIRIFMLNKIASMLCLLFGLLAIKNDFIFLGEVSKILYSVSTLIIASFILLNPSIMPQISKMNTSLKKVSLNDKKNLETLSNIIRLIKKNESFLKYNYTINNLANDSEISTINIREVIIKNGYKNYSEFINSFRINKAIDLLQNEYLDLYSIESLFKDSGFQSEATFYRVFKKVHGYTPKEYYQTFINKEQFAIVLDEQGISQVSQERVSV
jgi:AraC-like DNA-binding protein